MESTAKTIVITGASSGIGRATALRLARKGWHVFAAVRKDSDAAAIKAESRGALESVLLDVTDHKSIIEAARCVTETDSQSGDSASHREGSNGCEPELCGIRS